MRDRSAYLLSSHVNSLAGRKWNGMIPSGCVSRASCRGVAFPNGEVAIRKVSIMRKVLRCAG